jgi:hypothetical protein
MSIDRSGRCSKSLGARPHLSWRECILFALVVAYGVILRCWDLGSKPFWVDEAESGINALTILQHGVPVDHYLDLPLFENTLTQPWPESAEYEFKDSSYSDRGLAIYHGWLPLYATAATFALAGITPDEDATARHVQHTRAEMRWRTTVGRIPAVVFGGLFLVAVFFAGREMYGPDAGWAALVLSAVCRPAIDFSRQARYYSATLALTTYLCLLIWLMINRGRWRDFLLCAVFLVLLFHTHALSFLTTCAVLGVVTPCLLRHRHIAAKLSVLAVVVALGVIPWLMWTGFSESTREIPRAWSLLSYEDLLAFTRALGPFPALAILTLVWLPASEKLRSKLPDRLTRPFADYKWAFLFLAAWALIGLVAFVVWMPAASYFYGRLALTIMGPGILFGAMLFAAVARMIAPAWAPWLASGLFLLPLIQFGQADFWRPAQPPGTITTYDVFDDFRRLEMPSGTKLYATPNHHLVVAFYTGLPCQSVAPVRRSFLNQYAKDVWILEAGPCYESLTWSEIQRTLLVVGHCVSENEARQIEGSLAGRLLRADLQGRAASVTPVLEPAPDYYLALERVQRLKTLNGITALLAIGGNPIFKGYALADYRWWQVFYYRFVNPEARIGANLNYTERIRSAEAMVLPLDWVVFRCPPKREEGKP